MEKTSLEEAVEMVGNAYLNKEVEVVNEDGISVKYISSTRGWYIKSNGEPFSTKNFEECVLELSIRISAQEEYPTKEVVDSAVALVRNFPNNKDAWRCGTWILERDRAKNEKEGS